MASAPTQLAIQVRRSSLEYVEAFDEYYLHLFDVTQADLNWENPQVRAELADIVNFWRGKGVHASASMS